MYAIYIQILNPQFSNIIYSCIRFLHTSRNIVNIELGGPDILVSVYLPHKIKKFIIFKQFP